MAERMARMDLAARLLVGTLGAAGVALFLGSVTCSTMFTFHPFLSPEEARDLLVLVPKPATELRHEAGEGRAGGMSGSLDPEEVRQTLADMPGEGKLVAAVFPGRVGRSDLGPFEGRIFDAESIPRGASSLLEPDGPAFRAASVKGFIPCLRTAPTLVVITTATVGILLVSWGGWEKERA